MQFTTTSSNNGLLIKLCYENTIHTYFPTHTSVNMQVKNIPHQFEKSQHATVALQKPFMLPISSIACPCTNRRKTSTSSPPCTSVWLLINLSSFQMSKVISSKWFWQLLWQLVMLYDYANRHKLYHVCWSVIPFFWYCRQFPKCSNKIAAMLLRSWIRYRIHSCKHIFILHLLFFFFFFFFENFKLPIFCFVFCWYLSFENPEHLVLLSMQNDEINRNFVNLPLSQNLWK